MERALILLKRATLFALVAILCVVPLHASAVTSPRFEAPQIENPTPSQIRDLSNWQRSFLRYYFRHKQSVSKAQMVAFQRTLKWMHGGDPSGIRNLSPASLYLASPLVAQVKINRLVAVVPDASEMYVVYDIEPVVIFRHLLGPSSRVKVGDHLFFADKALRIGAEYSDDQLV